MRRVSVASIVFAGLLVVTAASGGPPAATASDGVEAEVSASVPDGGVVAIYFHGNKRCSTCRKLEAYSKAAIEKGFPNEIDTGRLRWRTVNVDESANRHFVTDFELVTKALVLVEYRDGEVARWRNLKLIWQLVGDEEGFLTYVRRETSDFLEEG